MQAYFTNSPSKRIPCRHDYPRGQNYLVTPLEGPAYARRFGYGVVKEYTGHGVHTAFHSGLVILHYDEPRLNTIMQPGMTFTIEPMLTMGDPSTYQWDDDWTVLTRDGSLCAQFEQTLAVTQDGAEILTVPSA